MFFLILEQIGNMELLFIGLIVLIVFGPRKIPELAKKAGKIMFEFRKVSNEFKETWEREAALTDEEKDAFSFDEETIATDPALPEITEVSGEDEPEEETNDEDLETESDEPTISEVTDQDQLEELKNSGNPETTDQPTSENTKRDWL